MGEIKPFVNVAATWQEGKGDLLVNLLRVVAIRPLDPNNCQVTLQTGEKFTAHCSVSFFADQLHSAGLIIGSEAKKT